MFIVTTREKFCNGYEGVIAEPTMEKAEHRWRIVDGSMVVAKTIVREEAAPQLGDKG